MGTEPSLPVKQVIRFPTRRREASPSNDIGAARFSAAPPALRASSGIDPQPFRAGLILAIGPPGLASIAIFAVSFLNCHTQAGCSHAGQTE